jgi:HAD superfamily hydrolase (TIGR01484 family)
VRDRLVANGIDQDLADYYEVAGQVLTVAEDFDIACREDVYQIMMGCREPDHPAIIQGAEEVKIVLSWDRAADVISTKGGKGSAIARILEYYDLEPSQAIAFGDSQNDLDMIHAVGTGVAMGNALPQVKAIADDVCLPVSEDGIYHYCLQHGFI